MEPVRAGKLRGRTKERSVRRMNPTSCSPPSATHIACLPPTSPNLNSRGTHRARQGLRRSGCRAAAIARPQADARTCCAVDSDLRPKPGS